MSRRKTADCLHTSLIPGRPPVFMLIIHNKPQHSIILFVPTPPATTCRVAKTNKQEILTQKGGQNVINTSQASPRLSSAKHIAVGLSLSHMESQEVINDVSFSDSSHHYYVLRRTCCSPACGSLTSLSDVVWGSLFSCQYFRNISLALNPTQRPNPRSKRL